MRSIKSSNSRATVFTHTNLEKVELVIADENNEGVIYLPPQRARKLAQYLIDAAARAENLNGLNEGAPDV